MVEDSMDLVCTKLSIPIKEELEELKAKFNLEISNLEKAIHESIENIVSEFKVEIFNEIQLRDEKKSYNMK